MGVEDAGTAATTQEIVLGRVAARLARHVEIVLAELDLTPSQYRVLSTLSLGPEGASRLAGNLAISKPSATSVVEGLVSRGLIDRQDDPNDRRRVALTLTGAGSRILRRADGALELRLDEILAHTGVDQAERARSGLGAWQEPLDGHRNAGRDRR